MYNGLTARQRLLHEHVDGDAVLGVHHDDGAVVGGALHGPQDLAVVGVEDARVGHEQLEAGDPLVVDEVVHGLQRVVVDVAEDHVEAVVDGAVAVGLGVPGRQPVLHHLAGALHGEVQDGGGATVSRRHRSRLERVGCERATEGQLHVGVHVDAAGDHVLASGVDGAVGADARGLARRVHGGDGLAVDEHIVGHRPARPDDGPAGDERSRHDFVRSP
jgi:hypothetical protein